MKTDLLKHFFVILFLSCITCVSAQQTNTLFPSFSQNLGPNETFSHNIVYTSKPAEVRLLGNYNFNGESSVFCFSTKNGQNPTIKLGSPTGVTYTGPLNDYSMKTCVRPSPEQNDELFLITHGPNFPAQVPGQENTSRNAVVKLNSLGLPILSQAFDIPANFGFEDIIYDQATDEIVVVGTHTVQGDFGIYILVLDPNTLTVNRSQFYDFAPVGPNHPRLFARMNDYVVLMENADSYSLNGQTAVQLLSFDKFNLGTNYFHGEFQYTGFDLNMADAAMFYDQGYDPIELAITGNITDPSNPTVPSMPYFANFIVPLPGTGTIPVSINFALLETNLLQTTLELTSLTAIDNHETPAKAWNNGYVIAGAVKNPDLTDISRPVFIRIISTSSLGPVQIDWTQAHVGWENGEHRRRATVKDIVYENQVRKYFAVAEIEYIRIPGSDWVDLEPIILSHEAPFSPGNSESCPELLDFYLSDLTLDYVQGTPFFLQPAFTFSSFEFGGESTPQTAKKCSVGGDSGEPYWLQDDVAETVEEQTQPKLLATTPKPEITLYPNPVSNLLVLQTKTSSEVPSTIKIFDASGKLWFSKQQLLSEVTKITLENLPEGIFFCKIQNGENQWIEKFIISRK